MNKIFKNDTFSEKHCNVLNTNEGQLSKPDYQARQMDGMQLEEALRIGDTRRLQNGRPYL